MGRLVAGVLLACLVLAGCSAEAERDFEAPSEADVAERGQEILARAQAERQQARAERRAERAERREAREKARKAKARKARRRAAREAAREPLRGPWGVYRGPADMAWGPYEASSGENRTLLGHIANQPKAQWFGAWIPTSHIYAKTRDYIVNAQGGNPDALVQLAIFRMDPWYTASKTQVPSPGQVADYKAWIDESARAIGDTRAAIIVQPDSTFLRTVPNFELSAGLIRYAAQKYGALPNARVYLETGGWDWPAPGQGGAAEAVRLLEAAGMEYADGVATNTTHYNSTALDVQRIAEIVRIFAERGQPGLKGVVNTSSNGNGFDFGTYTGPDPDHAFVCQPGQLDGTCVTLGIPPTSDVANPRWGLDPETRKLADTYVDGYLWIGRPWLYRQNQPFQLDRALALVRSTPWR